jgi:hypothetical protein
MARKSPLLQDEVVDDEVVGQVTESDELLAKIRLDSKYKKFKQILQAAQEKVTFQPDREEALALHAGLLVRTLYGKKQFSSKSILESLSQVQANRSRLVELRVRSSVHISYVKESSKALKRYVYTQYAEDLKVSYKTKDQREALLMRLTDVAEEFLAEGENHIELLDTFIKDLDQAGFTLRDMVKVLEMLVGKEGKLL